jgi:predicted metal-dependent phosphoesterase TrpH
MPDIIADLHTHTTASDGELSSEQLVDLAAENGVRVLAVTDHDTVAGVPAAIARGRERGVEVVTGCELTAYEGKIELHVLALMFDLHPGSALQKLLEYAQEGRRTRALEMTQKLTAAGFPIEMSDVLDAVGDGSAIGRPHVAAALVKRGHARSMQAAFVQFLDRNGPGYVEKARLTPEDVFKAVHASGGVAILAHPGAVPHDELIAPLLQRGMDGVEAHYRAHSEMNRRFYAGLARRYGKVISGGSDFHGPTVRPGVLPGDGGVDREVLASLRRAAERVKQ